MKEQARRLRVLSTGSATPSQAIDNDKLEQLFGAGVAAAAELVGVSQRFWAVDVASGTVGDEDRTSALCARAAFVALAQAGIDANEIDLLILATYTPDYPLPGTVPELLRALAISQCTAFELRASCSGLGIALTMAERLLVAGRMRIALILCCELNSLFLPLAGAAVTRSDWVNLALFSDGASAMLLAADEQGGAGEGLICCFSTTLAPPGECPLVVRGGGSVHPPGEVQQQRRLFLIEHDPKSLEANAPLIFQRSLVETLARAGIGLEEVDVIIPPQANGYLYSPLTSDGKPSVYLNVERFGNTTSASIGIALDEAVRRGAVKSGDLVMLLPFSAAKFVAGGALFRWTA